MNGLDTVRALVQQGYTPVQAAALAGHMQQESGFDPSNVNPKEGAHGLLQWEGPRWDALQSFAKSQGKDPTDPSVQMAFIGHEMGGSEAKAGAAFKSATDIPSASNALKSYIRFGDDSADKRTGNAMNLYSQYAGSPVGALAQGPVAPMDPTSPIDPTQSVAAAGAPASLAAPPSQVGALAAIQSAGKALQGTPAAGTAAPTQPDFLPPQQIAMAQANPQAAQIAAAIRQQYGLGV